MTLKQNDMVNHIVIYSDEPRYRYIAEVKPEFAEFATLFEAAPDLLEALTRLVNVAGQWKEDSLEAALDQAYEAISKAKGGSK